MNKIMIVVAGILALASSALAGDMASVAWNQANIGTLRSVDKAAVATFLNEQQRKEGLPPGIPFVALTARDIDGFGWAAPRGNEHYQLLVASSGRCAHSVTIYNQDASGRVTTAQVLAGVANLKTAIRDLNGDGNDEVIVEKTLVEYSCVETIRWPAVYRLEDGKYVEASRDFPEFYDHQVLPKLNDEIGQYEANGEDANSQNLSRVIVKRDKILRVLGRNPTAGVQQAYQWMNTDNPRLLLYAAATFRDVSGHAQDANAAAANFRRALCEREPGMAMCHSAPSPKTATH